MSIVQDCADVVVSRGVWMFRVFDGECGFVGGGLLFARRDFCAELIFAVTGSGFDDGFVVVVVGGWCSLGL